MGNNGSDIAGLVMFIVTASSMIFVGIIDKITNFFNLFNN